MSKTRIFISSTCYDLSQIRKDLKEGIEAMGHEAILSENKDFPINPSLTSVENCIEAVRNDIDVFVLIIGNKYGCKLVSGKSITNSEFLTAVEMGIPVYTFSLKQMVGILPVWKRNKDADFSYIVDDNKVFEFLEDVREKRSKWNFEFESAQDILEILKSQLSFLFKLSLQHQRIMERYDSDLVSSISGQALKLLVDKPDNYEMRIYLQMMKDEISKYRYLKKDCVHAITFKTGTRLRGLQEVLDWHYNKLTQLEKTIFLINKLNDAFRQYFGENGESSDIEGLYYVALRYGEFYAYLLNWVIDVRSTDESNEFSRLVNLLSRLPMKAIEQLEVFPAQALEKINQSLTDIKKGKVEKGSTISLCLSLSTDDRIQEEISEELERLTRMYSRK